VATVSQLFTNFGFVRPATGRRRDRRVVKQCAEPGCTNMARQVQAAKYCEEHATAVDYEWRGRGQKVVGVCVVCAEPVIHFARTVIPLCDGHRGLMPHIKRWRAHGVPEDRMREWVIDPRCWVCDKPLNLLDRSHASDAVHVDHDHDCHPGAVGCEACVRGLAHQWCNIAVGYIDALIVRVGIDRAMQVVTETADRKREIQARRTLGSQP
jgi:hypothetical protein